MRYKIIFGDTRVRIIEVRPDGYECPIGLLPKGADVHGWINDYKRAANAALGEPFADAVVSPGMQPNLNVQMRLPAPK